MRILGLDVGEKRIGCAISDFDEKIAFGLSTIEIKNLKKSLKSVLLEYNPGMIVCGMPLTMDGKKGHQAKRVLGFIERLKKITSLPIVLWDERLSTKEAERVLGNSSRDKKRKVIDKLSSQLILQGFLNRRNFNNA